MTPLTPQQQVEFAQRRLYWRRHAVPTCFVVATAIAISALASPLNATLLIGSGLAGALLFVGELLADRQHTTAAVVLAPVVLLLFVWSVAEGGVQAGDPIMWVQGIGTMSLTFLGARVIYEKLRSA